MTLCDLRPGAVDDRRDPAQASIGIVNPLRPLPGDGVAVLPNAATRTTRGHTAYPRSGRRYTNGSSALLGEISQRGRASEVSFGSGNAKNPPIAWIGGFSALGCCGLLLCDDLSHRPMVRKRPAIACAKPSRSGPRSMLPKKWRILNCQPLGLSGSKGRETHRSPLLSTLRAMARMNGQSVQK